MFAGASRVSQRLEDEILSTLQRAARAKANESVDRQRLGELRDTMIQLQTYVRSLRSGSSNGGSDVIEKRGCELPLMFVHDYVILIGVL